MSVNCHTPVVSQIRSGDLHVRTPVGTYGVTGNNSLSKSEKDSDDAEQELYVRFTCRHTCNRSKCLLLWVVQTGLHIGLFP